MTSQQDSYTCLADVTHRQQEVRVRAMEVGDPQHARQAIVSNEWLVESRAEGGLDTHGLQDKHAHSHNTLLRRLVFRAYGIEEDQDHEVVGAVGLDDERAKTLVDL